jgi:hypothetical protein
VFALERRLSRAPASRVAVEIKRFRPFRIGRFGKGERPIYALPRERFFKQKILVTKTEQDARWG